MQQRNHSRYRRFCETDRRRWAICRGCVEQECGLSCVTMHLVTKTKWFLNVFYGVFWCINGDNIAAATALMSWIICLFRWRCVFLSSLDFYLCNSFSFSISLFFSSTLSLNFMVPFRDVPYLNCIKFVVNNKQAEVCCWTVQHEPNGLMSWNIELRLTKGFPSPMHNVNRMLIKNIAIKNIVYLPIDVKRLIFSRVFGWQLTFVVTSAPNHFNSNWNESRKFS